MKIQFINSKEEPIIEYNLPFSMSPGDILKVEPKLVIGDETFNLGAYECHYIDEVTFNGNTSCWKDSSGIYIRLSEYKVPYFVTGVDDYNPYKQTYENITNKPLGPTI